MSEEEQDDSTMVGGEPPKQPGLETAAEVVAVEVDRGIYHNDVSINPTYDGKHFLQEGDELVRRSDLQEREEALIAGFTELVHDYIQIYLDYIDEQVESEEYVEGWRAALHALGTDMLGRKSEDSVELIKRDLK